MKSEHNQNPYRHFRPSDEGGAGSFRLWLVIAALLGGTILLAPRAINLHAASREAPATTGRTHAAAELETPEVSVRTLPSSGRKAADQTARTAEATPAPQRARRMRSAAAEPRRARSTVRRTRVARERRIRRSEPQTQVAVSRPEAPRRERRRSRRTITQTRTASAPREQTLSAETLNLRAYRLQRRGQHREAEPLLREALRKNPRNAYAQYNLGWSLVRQGRSKEAVLYLKKTSRAQPRRWEPLDKLADAYEQMGDKRKATEVRERMEQLRGRRSQRTETERSANPPTSRVEVRTALSAAAWQQSTDRREEAWLTEKRAGLPTARTDDE